MTSSVPITHLTALVVSRFEALTSAFMRSNVAVWSSLAAVAGVLSHVLYFIRGEHQKQALLLFKLFFWLPLVACLVLVQLFRMNVSHAVQSVAAITAAYTVSLWTSMIIYRSFFHRLHRFPGPPWAKTSKLYHAFQLGKRDNYRKLAGWHQTYGNFVRIGKPPSCQAPFLALHRDGPFPARRIWSCSLISGAAMSPLIARCIALP